MFLPALFRFREEAPIEHVYYDTEKGALKNLKFISPFQPRDMEGLTHEALTVPLWDKLYSRMEKHSALIGVALVNGVHLFCFYPTYVEYIEFDKVDVIPNRFDYSYMQEQDLIPVGFEKTYCPCIETLITPGRIFYDFDSRKIYYKGEWIISEGYTPDRFTGKSLYKQLLSGQPKKSGVVNTDTGKPKFLD